MQNCQQAKKPVLFSSRMTFSLWVTKGQLSTKNTAAFLLSTGGEKEEVWKHLRTNLPRKKTGVNNSRGDRSCSIIFIPFERQVFKFIGKLARPGQGVADLWFEKAFDIVGFSTLHSCVHRSLKTSKHVNLPLQRTHDCTVSVSPWGNTLCDFPEKICCCHLAVYEKSARKKVNTEAHASSKPFFSSNHKVSLYYCNSMPVHAQKFKTSRERESIFKEVNTT